MPKRIIATIEWATEEEKADAFAKAENRGKKFATYVKQHFKKLPHITPLQDV